MATPKLPIAIWARAATGLAELRALKLARFGDNMRQVADTEGDKVEAQARLGFSVNGYGVSDPTGSMQTLLRGAPRQFFLSAKARF